MSDLSQRQAEMRQRYLPALERRRSPRRNPVAEASAIKSAPRQRHVSSECEIGWHYLNCPDLNCDCTCHVADGECRRGAETQ